MADASLLAPALDQVRAEIDGFFAELLAVPPDARGRLYDAMRYAVIMFIFGFISPSVDNFAHAGGFAGGYLTSAFFNPLTRERGDHLLLAAICLAATFLAILASVIKGLTLFS